MSRRTSRRVLLAIAVSGLIIVAANVAITAIRAAGYPRFWADLAALPIEPGAVRIVALGDSATVAVGASDPMNGFVGRIARLAETLTSHPVHVTNLAVGGATAGEVLRAQLPEADLAGTDLVIYCSSNDLERRIPVADYREHLEAIAEALPAERTVFSDLPLEPGRDPYQAVLREVADRHGIARADFATVFNGPGRRLDIFSALPPHLNDLGYQFWFEAFRGPVTTIVSE